MENEHIVATGIYYWHLDNLTQSRLNFRQAVDDPQYYEQFDDEGVKFSYGIQNDDPAVEDLGTVTIKAGRCMAFPNIYQHRLSPYRLIDPTREGVRRILFFFLVDPLVRVRSTATVPPQQASVVSQCLSEVTGLGTHVTDRIAEFVVGVYDRNEAEVYRVKLSEERMMMTDDVTKEVFERPFSLCEH